jgi:hypothetical protein
MVTWTDNIPDAGHTLANDQPLIENNFTYLATDLAVDHNFTKNSVTAQDGYHKVIHFVNQGGDPAPVANTGQLYTRSRTLGGNTDQVLYFEGGGGRISILTNFFQAGNQFSLAANGYTSLGPLLVQWGTANVNASGTFTVIPYNVTFPTAVYNVQVTCRNNSGASNPSANNVFFDSTFATLPLQQFRVSNSSTGSTNQIFWFAIGN